MLYVKYCFEHFIILLENSNLPEADKTEQEKTLTSIVKFINWFLANEDSKKASKSLDEIINHTGKKMEQALGSFIEMFEYILNSGIDINKLDFSNEN